MDTPEPIIHLVPEGTEPAAIVDGVVAAERDREPGVHIVVLVTADGNVGYARVHDEGSPGHDSQRWLEHARRGSSPGGWSELHHPRSEEHVGAWKEQAAQPLDRLLIRYSKRAWGLEAEPPYAVEFPVVPLAEAGLGAPATPA